MLVRELLTKWSFDADAKGVQSFASKLTSAKGIAMAAGAAIAGAAGAVFGLARSAATSAIEFEEMGKKVGLSADTLVRLSEAAKDVNVEKESLQTGLIMLQKQLGGSKKDTKAFIKEMEDLGVKVTDSGGKLLPVTDIINVIADETQRLGDGSRANTIAFKAFGRGGTALLPMLKMGSARMREIGDAAIEAGLGFDENATEAARKYDDAMDDLSRRARGLTRQIGAQLLPIIADLAKEFNEWWRENNALIRQKAEEYTERVVEALKVAWHWIKRIVLWTKKWVIENKPLMITLGVIVGYLMAMKLIGEMVTGVKTLITVLKPLLPLLSFLTKAFGFLGRAMLFAFRGGLAAVRLLWTAIMANPIAALAALIAGLAIYTIKNWESIKHEWEYLWKQIKWLLSDFVNWAGGVWSSFVGFFRDAWNGFAEWFDQTVIQPIASKIQWVVDKARGIADYFTGDDHSGGVYEGNSAFMKQAALAQNAAAGRGGGSVSTTANINVTVPSTMSTAQQDALTSQVRKVTREEMERANRQYLSSMWK